MRYKSTRGIGELILICFVGALLLLSLYAYFAYQSRTGLLILVLALLEAGMLYFYLFRTEYELTEDALIIRERRPFKGRSIPYADMKNYRIGGRAGGRMGRLYDIYLIYTEGGKDRFLILSPENRDDFVKNLRHLSGRSLEEDEVI
jgi:hypothetical protein